MKTTAEYPETSLRVDRALPAAGCSPDDGARRARKLEAIGCLTGRLAHDFSNLLQVIAGYADLLQTLVESGSTDLARIGRASEAIRVATAQAAELSGQLLAYTREDDAVTPAIDLNADVGKARLSFGDVDVLSVPLPGLWATIVDPTEAETALVALLRNAREAMPAGGPITVETGNILLEDRQVALTEGVAAGRYVTLSVTDTGTGMPPEVLARAIEPFFTTRKPPRERGLGLTLVDGFARGSGGAARISSVVGRGTTVRLLLPADAAGMGGDPAVNR